MCWRSDLWNRQKPGIERERMKDNIHGALKTCGVHQRPHLSYKQVLKDGGYQKLIGM